MFDFVLGALVGAGAILIGMRAWRDRGAAAARLPDAPSAPAATPESALVDPLTSRLYELQRRVQETPRVSTPEDLLQLRAFLQLVDELSAETVEVDALLRYVVGEDAILAWASLQALGRRPRDPAIERRLFGWLNHFSPWTRHFMLRTLEAWSPADDSLAGRVLVRLDSTWEAPEASLVLESFLRRSAGSETLVLPIDRPLGFEASTLRDVLARVDTELSAPVLEQLGPARRTRTPTWPGGPGDPGVSELEDLGRVSPPGTALDAGLIPTPSTDRHLERVMIALTSPPIRSTLVVGESGVGKTALIRRVTARLSSDGWTVFEAGASRLNAGMTYVGMLEARVQALIQHLAEHPRVVWVAPDFHQLLTAGRASNNPTGLLELILPAIESGELLVLGETRPAALERVLLERPEVARLFEVIRIEPPPARELGALLEAWSRLVTERRGVRIPAAIRDEALSLSRQYLSAETPPGGVLRLLDRAVLIASRRPGAGPEPAATEDDLVDALVQITGLSAEILDERRPLDLEAVRGRIESRVVGQTEAVDSLVERLALIKAGVTDPTRPYGVFLFAGGTGTGKTELAKALADYLFGSPDRLLRLDMSELQDGRALDRLLGSGEGFLGGNSLAERVRRQPFCVVLLDEFEKAHGRVWDVFLQVFDDGRLTDHRGDTVDFRHAIIILTSNVGSVSTGDVRLGLVGGAEPFSPTSVERAVERTFRPELLNRLDRVVVFRPLTREIMRRILRKELADAFERRGLRRRDWAVEMEESALDLLVERGFSAALGARPLKRALERYLLAPLARAIVDRSAPEGDQFLFVRADGPELKVEFVDPDATMAETGPAAAPGNLGDIVYDPRGNHAEVERLRGALESLRARTGSQTWSDTKRALMAAAADPAFWERADRFESLGRAEYLDRIESSLRSAASLFERLAGGPSAPRPAYPLNLVRRLAQQLFLLEAAAAEALAEGPRDAFVSVVPQLEDGAAPARDFAAQVAAMYEAWASARGMRWTGIEPGTNGAGARLLSITGFAAYSLLLPEDGLHVLEREVAPGDGARRATVRVRVVSQPATPARDAAGLRRQAIEALAAPPAAAHTIVRRYREAPSPLVRDAVRGWRTGRIERVLAGDFDVIPSGD